MSISQALYTFYTGRGIPASSAAALAGVQNYENGSTLSVPNPGGDAPGVWGISQWTDPSRQAAAIAGGAGPGTSLDAQASYTLSEIQSRNPSLYASIMDGTATPSQIVAQYEVPSGVVGGRVTGGPALNEVNAAGLTQSQLLGGSPGQSSTGDPFEDVTAAGATDEGSIMGNDPLGSSVTMNNSDIVSGSAGSVDFNDIGANAFDQDLPSDPASAVGSVNAGTLAQSLGGGAPINITDLPGLDTSVTGAGSAIQKGAGTIGTDVQQSAGGIVGTAASIFNNAQTYFSSAVVVVALVILGLVFVAFGLGMFKHNLAAAV